MNSTHPEGVQHQWLRWRLGADEFQLPAWLLLDTAHTTPQHQDFMTFTKGSCPFVWPCCSRWAEGFVYSGGHASSYPYPYMCLFSHGSHHYALLPPFSGSPGRGLGRCPGEPCKCLELDFNQVMAEGLDVSWDHCCS